MEYKTVQTYLKEIDGRTVPGIAAVIGNVDSGGDMIHGGAFKKTLKENAGRIKHLWQHNYQLPPVAAIKELKEVGVDEIPDAVKEKNPDISGGLLVVREYLETPRGNEILEGIRKGAITEMSFGYDPIKFDFEEIEVDKKELMVRHLRELRLWDTSDVVWGMNESTVAAKSAVPYKDTGTADEGTAWSSPSLSDFGVDSFADLSSSGKTRIAGHYAWSVSLPPDSLGDLKLPHHKASSSGIGPAVWRGVSAAMGALMGARGGVSIPSADVPRVHSHLKRHYAQFDRDAPPLKFVNFVRTSFQLDEDVLNELKFEVMGDIDFSKVEEIIAVLQEILASAEPPSEETEKDLEEVIEETQDVAKALTERVMQRLAIAQRESYLILNE